ncbi:2-dehydro-3-deoxygalactonokinase [Paracoccus fontiphilus]|uniref:2-dehydro-3-deoxygalactonokinase n=1 Tax=Paracoccus fontiphilus TaxID=1815556 RepID=A0ABV7IBT8_9RHOB|nr:2-dehydro-3-deoxygalactonokinase [Paracoccus fontiphilus]
MDQADWAAVEAAGGTLRLWLMHDGAAGAGITAPDNADPVAALREMLLPLLGTGARIDVIAAGWPGSASARVPCAPPPPLPPVEIDPQITLHRLPGLVQDRPTDLIGTAAARIAGHLATHPDFDGVLCLPGEGTVWAHVGAGEIVSFRSFLTVELLDRLTLIDSAPDTGPGFAEAVRQAMSRPAGLAGDLSTIRAQVALEHLDLAAAHAATAGLLIGAELAAARPWWLGQAVTILGAGWLADRYAEALGLQRVVPAAADPTQALLDGFRAARRML